MLYFVTKVMIMGGKRFKDNNTPRKPRKKPTRNFRHIMRITKDEELPKALRKGQKKTVPKTKKTKPKTKSNIKFKRRRIIAIVISLIVIFFVINAIISHNWKMLAKDMIANENSIVKDSEGNEIAKIGQDKKKIKVSYDKIPDNLKNAYVAIEDERFFKHHGVDLKRTASATFSYIIHFGKSSFGGSTITQQLVKNFTGNSTDSIGRKIEEWNKAWAVESVLSKEEILGGYLNAIYVGPNIYGVGAGAKFYFNKNVENLSLAECAFLAGINNSPNSYNPFERKR